MAAFALLAYTVSYTVVMDGVDSLEIRHAEESMHQLQNYLRATELQMHQRAVDWACWDEAYAYMENHDDTFIENNFDDDFLRSQNISFAAFFDTNAKTPFQIVDNCSENEVFTAEDLKTMSMRVVEKLNERDTMTLFGYTQANGRPFVIAAHRVFDGNQMKTPHGVLVMARIMDSYFVEDVANMIRQKFSILPVSSFSVPALSPLPSTSFKFVQNSDHFKVYALKKDVFGAPVFCLEVVNDRDISKMGQSMSNKNFLLMLSLGLALLLTGLLILHQQEKDLMRKEVSYRISHDSLTGLANKNAVHDALPPLLNRASGTGRNLVLLFIDLNRFKNVNDSYGHHVGDEILRGSAMRIETLFPEAFVARMGGDEFLVALICSHRQDIVSPAERLVASLSEPFEVENYSIHLGASVGIASYPGDAGDLSTLLQRAELAMFFAKAARKSTFLFFDGKMADKAARRMHLETDLYKAVEDNSFAVFYQPKVDSVKKRVVGLEALIRWKRNDVWVPPAVFVPVAEEANLVTKLDMFVLRSACREAKRWASEGLGVRISVNMSAKSILSEHFADEVWRIMNEEGVPARYIGVEVTETCILTHLDMASSAIAKLAQRGIEVSLDDFGTGYSSLLYLHTLPLSCLKIDKKFIDDINAQEGSSNSLVKGILALARGLGMATVAEGVEKREQLDFLTQNACSVIQGYFFSKPLPVADCDLFLRQQKTYLSSLLG